MKQLIEEKVTMDNVRQTVKYVVVPVGAVGLGFYAVKKTGSSDALKAMAPVLVAAFKFAE